MLRRPLAVLVAIAVALTLAGPAGAATVNRQVATKPDASGQAQGYLRAWRYNPSANWMTWVSACCYVPDINKPQYHVGRPDSDLYAADYAAAHFWPGCRREWYAVSDQRSVDGSYHTFFHITC